MQANQGRAPESLKHEIRAGVLGKILQPTGRRRTTLPHLQTQFWHCNMLIGNCDINMSFLSQNFRVFARAMSFVPELCSSSQNTSHTYVSTCHINVLTSINYGKSQLIISKTQSSDALNGFCNKMNSSLDSSSRTLSGLPELCL